MSDEIEKMHQEIATRNSQVAVKKAIDVERNLTERVDKLEALVMTLHEQYGQLNIKYNLLLTKYFNGGSTT